MDVIDIERNLTLQYLYLYGARIAVEFARALQRDIERGEPLETSIAVSSDEAKAIRNQAERQITTIEREIKYLNEYIVRTHITHWHENKKGAQVTVVFNGKSYTRHLIREKDGRYIGRPIRNAETALIQYLRPKSQAERTVEALLDNEPVLKNIA